VKNCPIIEHYKPAPTSNDLAAIDRLATNIRQERPRLVLEDDFLDLVPTALDDAPTLHLDDLSAISYMDAGRDVRFYQERARLRAGDGDVVATSDPVAQGYEAYCRDTLRLGAVDWLHPRPIKNPLRIAEACWEDPQSRSLLIERIRSGVRYVHPHMGTFAVWELAALLRDVSGCPMKVIAPPPRLCSWVNDKIAFAEVVSRLFGPELVPRTMSACNFAILAQRVRDLARSSATIGIKLPNSAGGEGVVVLDGGSFAGDTLSDIRDKLKTILPSLNWSGESELLIDSWEADVVCSPSAQLWIPPPAVGEPIVEGVYIQALDGPTGMFAGSIPADLPIEISQEIATRSWMLGRLFQRLGYIGRCSFDLILVGESASAARLEFVECNGRWGGTSAPMTLMNRLFGDWARQPYVSQVCEIARLDSVSFQQLRALIDDDLFDRASESGRVILSIPGRIAARSAIDVIGIGHDSSQAESVIKELSAKLRERVGGEDLATALISN
jgi:hypothetical protein